MRNTKLLDMRPEGQSNQHELHQVKNIDRSVEQQPHREETSNPRHGPEPEVAHQIQEVQNCKFDPGNVYTARLEVQTFLHFENSLVFLNKQVDEDEELETVIETNLHFHTLESQSFLIL